MNLLEQFLKKKKKVPDSDIQKLCVVLLIFLFCLDLKLIWSMLPSYSGKVVKNNL